MHDQRKQLYEESCCDTVTVLQTSEPRMQKDIYHAETPS